MTNIEKLAEEYRKKLGLRTWEEQAAWAEKKREEQRDKMSEAAYEAYKGRQTGRTTRRLLHAIARCAIVGSDTLIVEGYSDTQERAIVSVAERLISQLGLKLTVVRYRLSRTSHYVDHLAYDSRS